MNEFKELDILIKEHEIYKKNVSWEKSEILFANLCRIFFSFFMTLFTVLIIGFIGIFLSPLAFALSKKIFIYPSKKDPFKKYVLK